MTSERTLLLTDIVDSTRLAERLGDERIAEIWIAHDRAIRDLLPAWRGVEVDRTDGFLLLFQEVSDAVGFAAAMHRELAGLSARFGVPFAARVGVHWGRVVLIETSAEDRARGAKPLELEGLAKPFAARIGSVALGGQTLLSAQARARLGDSARAVSHGCWRMQGVAEPVELFEVDTSGAPLLPPPDAAKIYRVVRDGELWQPVREVRRSLPTERDVFVGRERDLQELARLVAEARLVTVLGIGGTGKTRLVTRFAWTWLGDFPGGAWFCDLSEARGVDGIAHAVATALDVPLGKDDPVVQLGHALAARGPCLVVLDNFEQVTRFASATLGRWLDRASDARFVVTSREVLSLSGEATLALAPLPLAHGVDLFVARARQARRDFALAAEERADVDQLVTLLDGLPLAIELAAARARVMTPSVLLQRMSERFKLLASPGGRTARHATLRAALDWSWDLLSEDEQAALVQLSVFEGGFGLQAAEAVLSLSEAWPMDAVQALVDKSLVRRVAEDRFDLLVSVQAYAAEKLDALDAPGARSQVEARHGAHFAGLGPDDVGVAKRLAPDLDNVVAACRRAVLRGDAETAAATLRAAWVALALRGPFGVAATLASSVLAMPELSPRARGEAAFVLGSARDEQGGLDARAHLDEALEIARAAGDRRFEAGVLRRLGALLRRLGRPDEARERFEAALALARDAGDRALESVALGAVGTLCVDGGRPREAEACYVAALEMDRARGDRQGEGLVLGNLAVVYAALGQWADALSHYEAALAIARELGDRPSEARALANLGTLHRDQGRPAEAWSHLAAALVVNRELGARRAEGVLLDNLGLLHLTQGRLDPAEEQFEAALRVTREVGDRRSEGFVLAHLGGVQDARGRPEEARTYFEAALAVAREVGNRRSEGFLLGMLGVGHLDAGREAEAQAHLEAALAIARQVGNRPHEGLFLGHLGGLAARQGRPDEARAAFEAAEHVLRAVGPPFELGHVLARRAALEREVGRPEVAAPYLAEAERLAALYPADAALGRRVASARAAGGPA